MVILEAVIMVLFCFITLYREMFIILLHQIYISCVLVAFKINI